MFDITTHKRVPKHRLLTKVEASKVLSETKLKASLMPRLLEDDPYVKYIGGEPAEPRDGKNSKSADIVEITRTSATIGTIVVYYSVSRRIEKKKPDKK